MIGTSSQFQMHLKFECFPLLNDSTFEWFELWADFHFWDDFQYIMEWSIMILNNFLQKLHMGLDVPI